MASLIREKLGSLFRKNRLPSITENSSLEDVAGLYPHVYDFLEKKYALTLREAERLLPLVQLTKNHGLPPPQVLFMEIQMVGRTGNVIEVTAIEAMDWLKKNPTPKILDVRESWELKMGAIRSAEPLTAELLDTILKSWDKEIPILLYCHFGVRSLDAASFLADRGFRNIKVLKGGIDSWSTEIDPSIPRYEGAYC